MLLIPWAGAFPSDGRGREDKACRAPLKVLGGRESHPRAQPGSMSSQVSPSQWAEARGEQFQRPRGARIWPGAGPLPAGSSRPDLANLIHFSSCHTLSLCLPVRGAGGPRGGWVPSWTHWGAACLCCALPQHSDGFTQWVHIRVYTRTLTVVPVDSWAPPSPQPGGCSFCLSRNLGRIHCGPPGASSPSSGGQPAP